MNQFTAISFQHFANKAWLRPADYTFAAKSNVIPVVAADLSNLAPSLPMAFMRAGATFQLMIITSLQPGTNLLVTQKGDWLGQYIPAVLRCYPFLLIKSQEKDKNIFCIDESSGLVVEPGRGETFFDPEGRPAHALKEMLDFTSKVEASRAVTQAAVDALQAADLIQPWLINMRNGDKTVAVEGFFRLDEAKLNAVSDEVFLSLRNVGSLPLAYSQLLSMSQLVMLEKADAIQARLKGNIAKQPQNFDGLAGFELVDSGTLKFS